MDTLKILWKELGFSCNFHNSFKLMLKLSNNILSNYSTSKKKNKTKNMLKPACNRILDLTHKIYNFIKWMQVHSVISRLSLTSDEE